MKKIKTAIIGGGASGLFLAEHSKGRGNTVLFERGERLGRKLSASGNGQGNISNLTVEEAEYFSLEEMGGKRASEIIRVYNRADMTEFFRGLGVPLLADERGRIYPAGKQGSALTDALRFSLENSDIEILLSANVYDLEKTDGGFILYAELGAEKIKESFFAEKVVLCAGGKAAKNFGTDGTAYALAKKFGHSVTPLYPSLVQLKTDIIHVKTLKGIRVSDAGLTAEWQGGKHSLFGDIIFTDYGVSGDAVFRISAFITDKISSGVNLFIDFLPSLTEEEIYRILTQKRARYPKLEKNELLFGVVNNQVGRAIIKRANGDIKQAVKLLKAFPLQVNGSLGFDYAQVTKGGIPLSETDENLQSRFVKGLYFAGEILDVDGQCGGFNLQWAYASAKQVAKGLNYL